MAIDAKVSFVSQMEKELASVLTVEQMIEMRRVAVGILDHFEMTELQMQEAGDDDLLDCYLQAMRVQSRSPKTIARYEYMIRRKVGEAWKIGIKMYLRYALLSIS